MRNTLVNIHLFLWMIRYIDKIYPLSWDTLRCSVGKVTILGLMTNLIINFARALLHPRIPDYFLGYIVFFVPKRLCQVDLSLM